MFLRFYTKKENKMQTSDFYLDVLYTQRVLKRKYIKMFSFLFAFFFLDGFWDYKKLFIKKVFNCLIYITTCISEEKSFMVYIYIYIYTYIQKIDQENTIYLVLRVSCCQSSAK